jgi:hypothetical protein
MPCCYGRKSLLHVNSSDVAVKYSPHGFQNKHMQPSLNCRLSQFVFLFLILCTCVNTDSCSEAFATRALQIAYTFKYSSRGETTRSTSVRRGERMRGTVGVAGKEAYAVQTVNISQWQYHVVRCFR